MLGISNFSSFELQGEFLERCQCCQQCWDSRSGHAALPDSVQPYCDTGLQELQLLITVVTTHQTQISHQRLHQQQQVQMLERDRNVPDMTLLFSDMASFGQAWQALAGPWLQI